MHSVIVGIESYLDHPSHVRGDNTVMSEAIDQAYEIREKLAALEESLLANTPGIASLLKDIHRQLKQDDSLATILSAEECSILVRGLKKQTATNIATAAIKKGTKKAMSKMQVGLDL